MGAEHVAGYDPGLGCMADIAGAGGEDGIAEVSFAGGGDEAD